MNKDYPKLPTDELRDKLITRFEEGIWRYSHCAVGRDSLFGDRRWSSKSQIRMRVELEKNLCMYDSEQFTITEISSISNVKEFIESMFVEYCFTVFDIKNKRLARQHMTYDELYELAGKASCDLPLGEIKDKIISTLTEYGVSGRGCVKYSKRRLFNLPPIVAAGLGEYMLDIFNTFFDEAYVKLIKAKVLPMDTHTMLKHYIKGKWK